jgi:superfamily II DNA or RNA helicase
MQAGQFVSLRGRRWLVEGAASNDKTLQTVALSCIADDAQGEPLEVLWDAEVAPETIADDSWSSVGRAAPDDPEILAAYLRTVRWNSATAAERDLFQAPFRAGIRLDPYQLLPLRKALRLPRVNLLIADDVGLGKTIEAGLIVREMLLRRRIDFVVVAVPASMTIQWQDELENKFGLAFTIIDRERVAEIRRTRGFSANPWRTGSRFIISHSLLTEETYAAGLRDVLGEFRPRALLILDEAHHAAPSGGSQYAISSQFTKYVREFAERFEHRLFLSATPHNGHSNSFSAMLEMLDPQRFTRGVEARPKDLEPVMVRRLKQDLRLLGEAFPERIIEPIVLEGLPTTTPELELALRLSKYGDARMRRIGALPGHKASQAKVAFVQLQQRLLSSAAAFAKTLRVHKSSLERQIEKEGAVGPTVAEPSIYAETADMASELGLEDEAAEQAIASDENAATEGATIAGAAGASAEALRAELAMVDDMLSLAEPITSRPDQRVKWLVDWIERNLAPDGQWNRRRLIVFTEYEDTRRWLERRLREALAETDRCDERIGVFTGATSAERREEIKRAFNSDPAKEPLRILICTDAAREGVNLQSYCADLIHFDLPWNPARLEQRNGRIDRKLQPAKVVTCRYFRYAQRKVDVVLDALVRKTERIRSELGSAGQVIEERITKRLAEGGIEQGRAEELAREIEAEDDAERLARARAEMDDDERVRFERVQRDREELAKALESSRERVGVDALDLRNVVTTALKRADYDLDGGESSLVGHVRTYALDASAPAFAREAGWDDVFDDLRTRPRKRGERIGDWRRNAPIRKIAFEPPVLPDGRDADDTVQVHLEHRLVRRLLSRFISQGFQSRLSRVSIILGPGTQPCVVMMARLAVYGPAAARLHEEILTVTADWSEVGRDHRRLRPHGEVSETKTLDQLERALRESRSAPPAARARIEPLIAKDFADLLPAFEKDAGERLAKVRRQLVQRAEDEAKSLHGLLEEQRQRILKASRDAERDDPNQFVLPGVLDEERRERAADRRHWQKRLERLERELVEEPARVRASYEIRAHRLEPVGLVYLWPSFG